tara:strand:+ start:863 stop:1921 length:1059 start_codon:yes stop_codon:yes gene_type:complete
MKKIIHVDMDAFFVSVEIRDKPSLAGKPVAVGGSRTARGVLSTCNYIAREYGVHSAMPTSLALSKCPGLILLPGRMDVYRQVSTQIREIFQRYTQLIEPLSLDEAYLDVSDCTLYKGSATRIAEDICNTIHRELSLTASAGVAPLKFLAKIASDINKPNGVFVITPNDVSHFIDDMPLNKISGVGKVTFEKLQSKGFDYGKDVKASNEMTLINQFGKLGKLLWNRCQGIDERDIVVSRVRKSVGVERTFSSDIDKLSDLQAILITKLLPELKTRAAKHLSSRHIQKIGVKVKFQDFHQTTKEFTFNQFNTALFSDLLTEAVKRGNGKKVRLLGAHISLSSSQILSQQYCFDW